MESSDGDDFSVCSKKQYRVLSEKDIRRRLDYDITTACSVLHVSKGEARILLTNFKFDFDRLTDAWFDDHEKVLKNSGLFQEASLVTSDGVSNDNFTCLICFASYLGCNMKSASCGHLFCENCYKSYIEFKILEGNGCVRIECPESNCVDVVRDDIIETLVSDECRKRFDFYVVRSYLEKKRNIKWCPSPGCDYAIEFGLESDNYDVKCDCSNMFCFNCGGECHRPVDCEKAGAWLLMNNDASANSLWLFAYTKPCPNCKNPIEKNHGCMHMTCSCCHQFCWMCLGDWSEHGEDYFRCDVYNEQTNNGWTDAEVNKREVTKYLKRYERYFEKWALNQSSEDKDKEKLKNWKEEHYGKNKYEWRFITEALLQIIECRRVLKWTYAYAFYMNKDEKIKKQFFEYLQGEAEAGLERLHHRVEHDLKDYLQAGGENHAIKLNVGYLTKTTNRFFENLVRALENGLEDVKDDPSDGIEPSKKKHAYGTSTRYDDDDDDDVDADDYADGWVCRHCSYYNNHVGEDCEMCALPAQPVG